MNIEVDMAKASPNVEIIEKVLEIHDKIRKVRMYQLEDILEFISDIQGRTKAAQHLTKNLPHFVKFIDGYINVMFYRSSYPKLFKIMNEWCIVRHNLL